MPDQDIVKLIESVGLNSIPGEGRFLAFLPEFGEDPQEVVTVIAKKKRRGAALEWRYEDEKEWFPLSEWGGFSLAPESILWEAENNARKVSNEARLSAIRERAEARYPGAFQGNRETRDAVVMKAADAIIEAMLARTRAWEDLRAICGGNPRLTEEAFKAAVVRHAAPLFKSDGEEEEG